MWGWKAVQNIGSARHLLDAFNHKPKSITIGLEKDSCSIRSGFDDQRFNFVVRYSTRTLYAKAAYEHRDEHFECTQLALK